MTWWHYKSILSKLPTLDSTPKPLRKEVCVFLSSKYTFESTHSWWSSCGDDGMEGVGGRVPVVGDVHTIEDRWEPQHNRPRPVVLLLGCTYAKLMCMRRGNFPYYYLIIWRKLKMCIFIFTEASFSLWVLLLPACVCTCVSVCSRVIHKFVCAITHHLFKPGSPNLDQKCKITWLRSLLFWGDLHCPPM